MINKNLNGGFNTSAIVISRKKHKLYSVFTFITPNLGIIRASLPHKRLQTLRNSSFLRPFSGMYITVVPDGEYVKVTQIDGSYVVETLDSNLENIAYTAVASELIQELFALYDVDYRVFEIVKKYSISIRRKSVRLGTIILGWQLLSLAGIMPRAEAFLSNNGINVFWNEVYLKTHVKPSLALRIAVSEILTYQWDSVSSINLTGNVWKELECLLFSYCEHELGKQLQSTKFLMSL